MVFSLLSVPTLSLLASTSKPNQAVVWGYLHRRSRGLVRTFVPNVENFFQILSWTRAALSGSTVLKFMMPESQAGWTPNDLDIYVPSQLPDTRSQMVDYLRFEGYVVVATVPFSSGTNANNYEPFGGILSVVKMRKGSREIDVVHSNSPTFFTCISHFHVTAVMNFISAQGFFSAYPAMTESGKAFASRLAYKPMARPSDTTIAAYRKYRNRGIRIYNIHPSSNINPSHGYLPAHHCRRSFNCPHTIRTTLDSGCLFVPFVPDGDSAVDTRKGRGLYHSCAATVWLLGGKSCDGSYTPLGPFSNIQGTYV